MPVFLTRQLATAFNRIIYMPLKKF